MAKKKGRRRRSTSEKIMIVLGIVIALSMIVSLFVSLGGGGRSASSSGNTGNSPLPESERFEAPSEPVGALDGAGLPLALASPSTAGPPV